MITRLLPLPLVLVVLPAFSPVCAAERAADSFQSKVLPVLKATCTECHGGDKPKAKVKLDKSVEELLGDPHLMFRVMEQVEAGLMPPEEEEKQPTDKQRKGVSEWIRGDFTALHLEKQKREGRSILRRLSRSEYANTVQDLFGLRPTVGINLPEDGRVDGYDKASAALALSASGAAGYFKMAEDLTKWVLQPIPANQAPQSATFDPARTVKAMAKSSEQSKGHILELEDGITKVSFNSDTTSGPLAYSGTNKPGLHRLRMSVYGYQTDKPLVVGVYAGHVSAYPQIIDLVKVVEVPPGPQPTIVETEVYLRSRDFNDRAPVGDGLRLIPFGLGVPVPKNSQASACKGPGLAVQWMEVESPLLPLPADRWLTADFPKPLDELLRNPHPAKPAADAARAEFLTAMRTTFQRVGTRLYRRDFTGPELEEIMAALTQQLDGGMSMKAAFFDQLTALMTSPDFLCLVEPAGKLSDFALASRLSYFLWTSTPDETLMALARQGKMHDPNVLRGQTERLLKDPKSDRFVTDFVNQWLGLRGIDDTSPDKNLYPEYGEFLKLSSTWETEGFFRRVLNENLGVKNFVAAPWAVVNEDLAKLYGIPAVTGPKLRNVDLPAGSPFGGLWTQSAVLKVTANGTNTSPVKRGRWVAERLLGTPIPPPPPNIKPVEPDVRGATTLREQFALHSSEGSCASCHARFDPYGFALESFDVMGGFRTNYRVVDQEVISLPWNQRNGRKTWRDGLSVDSTGKTPDGSAFANVNDLRKKLAENPKQLARGVTRHLITYATGTVPTQLDQQAIDRIVSSTAKDDYGLRSLIHALVQSEVFTWK